MSAAALDRFLATAETLIAALDGDEAGRIDSATAAFAAALDEVRRAGGMHDRPDIATRVARALQLTEAARGRVQYLADRTRRRLDRLALLGAPTSHRLAYRRDGRLGG